MTVATAARIGAIADAVVHVGTPAIRGAVDDLAQRATGSFHLDVFRVGDDAVVDTVESLARRDVPITVLADTDATTGRVAKALRRQAGDGWAELGTDPRKQHGKSASRDDGAEAFVGTDLADDDAARRIELGVTFDGGAAAALGRIHAASDGGPGLAAALDDAAATGVVANDPRTGARHATDAIELLVEGHGGRLRIMTKSFDDEALAERIAAAVRSGMDEPAELLTHHVPKSQERLLEDAGVVVRELDEHEAERARTALHGTLVDTNRGAFVGSPYLESRVLYGSDGRRSRELGVVLGGDAAARARAAYDELLAANR
jgi:hypothetical protein